MSVATWNEEAEENVLGGILVNARVLLDVADRLRPEHFYRPSHQVIYRSILELDGKGETPDTITVVEALKRNGQLEDAGGAPAVRTLSSTVSTTTNAPRYADMTAVFV